MLRIQKHPRRYPSVIVLYSIYLLISVIFCSNGSAQENVLTVADYSRLLEFIRHENKEQPLYTFNDYEEKYDVECHEASLDFLKQNPDLIQQIRSDLDSTRLKWKMIKNRKRTVYVPEVRSEFAQLYLNYCRDIIAFLIGETKLENPYLQIRHPARNFPEIPDNENRVTVFLVHNLAKQYEATYQFSSPSDKSKINVSLSGTVYTGEIGSYSSFLEIQDTGELIFVRNSYTIWQNSAKSPVNALILPLEETLHIALRSYTEGAIDDQWNQATEKNLGEARRIAAHWIAVEEAIAGGLAHHYFPQVADKYIKNLETSEIEQALDQRAEKDKYRYLKRGIRIIQSEGPDKVLDMYRSAPRRFRDLLVEQG
jgi:hypothetical protein